MKKHILIIGTVFISIVVCSQTSDDYFNRGQSKADLKDYSGAIQEYNKAIELKPNDAVAYNNRGLAKTDLADYKGAIQDFNKAIELNPNYADAYNNRGASKANLEDYSGAIKITLK